VLTKDSGTDYDTSWQDPTGGGGTPGGSDGQVQYNDGGAFGGADFGKVVADVAAWGSPGLVDPAVGDDSSGWMALLVDEDAQWTAGFGDSGNIYASLEANASRAGLFVGGTSDHQITSEGIGLFGAAAATQQTQPTTMNEVVTLLQTYGLSA
jgi:hypothetical protein